MSTQLSIMDEILAERKWQDEKFGEQNSPSHAGMIGPGDIVQYQIPSSDIARRVCRDRFYAGIGAWMDIAIEELAEVEDAAYDAVNPNMKHCTEQQVREELIQLAAVCVAWIECIDRRTQKENSAPTVPVPQIPADNPMIKPADCTCNFPTIIFRSGSGHGGNCPVNVAWWKQHGVPIVQEETMEEWRNRYGRDDK